MVYPVLRSTSRYRQVDWYSLEYAGWKEQTPMYFAAHIVFIRMTLTLLKIVTKNQIDTNGLQSTF